MIEIAIFIGMLICKANNLEVPIVCSIVWAAATAVHLGMAWFWKAKGENKND